MFCLLHERQTLCALTHLCCPPQGAMGVRGPQGPRGPAGPRVSDKIN